jgi:ABC-type bacteriocin/lantibiotic exporter with double-glycine peptidase domain
MMLLLQLLSTVSRYIWNIRQHLKEYYKAIVHIEKLKETFESIPQMKINKNDKEFIYKNGNIDIKNISFAYNKTNVFSKFNLNIQG